MVVILNKPNIAQYAPKNYRPVIVVIVFTKSFESRMLHTLFTAEKYISMAVTLTRDNMAYNLHNASLICLLSRVRYS